MSAKKQLKTYFDNMDYTNLSGGGWSPKKTWLRVHGDTKSSVNGAFHMETMQASNGDYVAKLVGSAISNIIVASAGSVPPTLPAVAAALRSAAGV